MKLSDIIKTANSNLLRSKLRTSLTIVAIFVGAFTLTLTSALGSGVKEYMNAQVSNLGSEQVIFVSPKQETTDPTQPQKYDPDAVKAQSAMGSSTPMLSGADLKKIEANKNLENVKPMVLVSPDYIAQKGGEKYQFSFSPITFETNFDLTVGKQLDFNSGENELLLPLNYLEPLGFKSAEDAVDSTVEIALTNAQGKPEPVEATVVGVLNKGLISATGIPSNSDLVSELHELQTAGLPDSAKEVYLAVTADMTGELTDDRIAEIKELISKDGFDSTTLDDQLGNISAVITTITYVLNGFALIALLAAAFGIINTLLMSVQERTREIGLMKSMGMSPRRIFTLFSVEAILIGFWGSLLGALTAMALGNSLNGVMAAGPLKDLPGFNVFAYSFDSVAFVVLLVMFIAFASGALPARRAAKLDPIEALRYE